MNGIPSIATINFSSNPCSTASSPSLFGSQNMASPLRQEPIQEYEKYRIKFPRHTKLHCLLPNHKTFSVQFFRPCIQQAHVKIADMVQTRVLLCRFKRNRHQARKPDKWSKVSSNHSGQPCCATANFQNIGALQFCWEKLMNETLGKHLFRRPNLIPVSLSERFVTPHIQ